MTDTDQIFIGRSEKPETLLLRLANRHGLIAGATGTGKTVSLQILAEGFSAAGVPVFLADIKGDLAGLAAAGEQKDFLTKRAQQVGLDPYEFKAFPVVFWDLFGKRGHPIRTTITEMGPVLLTNLLELNETQEGVLNIAFRVADEDGLLLLDLADLRSLLVHIAGRAKELSVTYGNISPASVGAIQRRLLTLEAQGGAQFFGEPALELTDIMRTDLSGRGIINILSAEQLLQSPRLYATCLLWILSELFEELPEVGDPDKPRLVFFFDEAHLLFKHAPRALVEKIEQVVRLIRSKGVGVYFCTQNPADIPDNVLGQLGNRIQHALRAFTPKDQKAIRAAAETFRTNPNFDAKEILPQLGVGEALVSTLQSKGEPSVVERTLIRPPSSRLGVLTDEERATLMTRSPVSGRYDKAIDRESASEILAKRAETIVKKQEEAEERAEKEGKRKRKPKRRSNRQSIGEAAVKSFARTISSAFGREIMRTILGTLRKR